MIKDFKNDIINGKLPLHIVSIVEKKRSGTIIKGKKNLKYQTKFFQLSPFYKSII